MPSKTAIGAMVASALDRIRNATDNQLLLPTHSRYGAAMLHVKQLEAIADYVETAQSGTSEIPENYTEAVGLARNGATKQAIVDALLGNR